MSTLKPVLSLSHWKQLNNRFGELRVLHGGWYSQALHAIQHKQCVRIAWKSDDFYGDQWASENLVNLPIPHVYGIENWNGMFMCVSDYVEGKHSDLVLASEKSLVDTLIDLHSIPVSESGCGNILALRDELFSACAQRRVSELAMAEGHPIYPL